MNWPTPRSPLADHLLTLAEMVSLSKEFQKQTGSDTASDAKNFIHFTSINQKDHPRPNAIIWIESFEYVFVSAGRRDDLGPGGVAVVYLSFDTDP